jgi:hypothetical protein
LSYAAAATTQPSRKYRPGQAHVHSATADVPRAKAANDEAAGVADVAGVLHLQRHANQWQVEWSPATIDPALPPGGHFSLDRAWPARAAVLGAGGTPLTVQAQRVTVGLQGSAIRDPAKLTAALVASGADPAAATTVLSQARAHPDQFVPVFDVSDERYQQIKPVVFVDAHGQTVTTVATFKAQAARLSRRRLTCIPSERPRLLSRVWPSRPQ